MCNSNNMEQKPTLILLDEVDGALESEQSGAINQLIEYIYNGPKKK